MIQLTDSSGNVLAPGSAGRAAYDAALLTSHRIRIRVTVRDSSEAPAKQLDAPTVLTGAVQVDATQAVTRSLSLTCLDPNHKLTFDKANPSDFALYADNFISVTYGVETSIGWVDVPVFWGPVTAYSRAGAEVTVEAQGKESLALDPHLLVAGDNLHRSTQISSAIAKVMGKVGESSSHIKLGMVGGKLAGHRAIARGQEPWLVCVGGATDANGKPMPGLMSKARGHQLLFYDGRGNLTAKNRGGNPVYVFDEQTLLGRPGFTYDVLEARNRVYMEGGTPKGKPKHHFTGTATLPSNHPLSAQQLARNGQPRYLTTMAQSDTLKSDAACRHAAQVMLAQTSSQGLDASFDCLPAPHLEELDPVRLVVPSSAGIAGYAFAFPLSTFAIPLTHDTPMTVGGHISPAVPQKASTPAHHHHPATHHHRHHHPRHHHRRAHH